MIAGAAAEGTTARLLRSEAMWAETAGDETCRVSCSSIVFLVDRYSSSAFLGGKDCKTLAPTRT